MAKKPKKTVTGRVLHDPVKDKLRPIFPLDLSKLKTIDDLVRAMGNTAYTARQVGDAADVLEAMARDKDCFVVMTLSGALTVGKMGLVFCDLIEIRHRQSRRLHRRAHGSRPRRSHRPLPLPLRSFQNERQRTLPRRLQPRLRFSRARNQSRSRRGSRRRHFRKLGSKEVVCSWKLHRRIGEYLTRHTTGRGILRSAYECNVPVFVPAFSDSELGSTSP